MSSLSYCRGCCSVLGVVPIALVGYCTGDTLVVVKLEDVVPIALVGLCTGGDYSVKTMSQLKYHFGVKFLIHPNQPQRTLVKVNSDAKRFVYNMFVAIGHEKFQIKMTPMYNPAVKKFWLDNFRHYKSLKFIKKVYPFLRDKYIMASALSYARRNYETAWKNYRSGFQGVPTFHAKKKHPYEDRYQFSNGYEKSPRKRGYVSTVRFKGNRVHLLKMGWVRTGRLNPELKKRIELGNVRIGTVTVYMNPFNRVYVSLQLASDIPFKKPLPKTGGMLGYDLNTSNFLMDSNGGEVDNPRYYEKAQKHLARLQQVVSRRYRHNKARGRNLKHCRNYQRARMKASRLQRHIMLQRKAFLNNLSAELIENQDFLVGEDLRSSNMVRNHYLAKSIASVGWREFIVMLQYKAKLYGKTFVLIDPKYTTQKCSNCGYICNHRDGTYLTLADREWTCPKCGKHHIRDVNAAVNILNKGRIKARTDK